MSDLIYLDHAATSWPKPPAVLKAMTRFLEEAGGNPGRSGHRLSIDAGRIVYQVREAVAALLNAPDPLGVIFTANGTVALNLALHGLLVPGDRVVTGNLEHNAVMRPLRHLEAKGIDLTIVPSLDPEAFRRALTPGTRLVVLGHASNICGAVAPVAAIAAHAHAIGALVLVDAAQSAGVLPIDMQAMGIDLLAFTGHKGLQGPTGTGGLVLGAGIEANRLTPLLQGGTGSRSEFEVQPEFLPDKFESGTPNGAGIAGLGAGIAWVMERGVETIHEHELAIARRLKEGLGNLPGVALHGPLTSPGTSVISFTVKGHHVSEIGLRLDEEAGVLARVGLHCAPAAHRTLGTFPEGTVRFAPGPLTTPAEAEAAIAALARILKP